MEQLLAGITSITIKQIIMIIIGGILIYLAIKKDYEPALLLPMGFGCILVNLPLSSAINQLINGERQEGILSVLFEIGIINELFPLLIFISVGAMIDFTPILQNPIMLLFGAAAQFGIFLTMCIATLLGFSLKQAASIGIIGAADGPTSIIVASKFARELLGAISVAAYSYMSLVPIIQPPVIKLLTSKEERKIKMAIENREVSKAAKILFPIIVTIISGLIAPVSVPLIGFLMFGNLLRECGVLNRLSEAAQKELSNIVTILLGLTISSTMTADKFLSPYTILIIIMGLIAFILDTAGGVLFAKFLNIFLKNKINPMIGASGISAFPMSARVVHKLALKEDPTNFLLMYSISANVAGQIGSIIAGGLILSLVK
ncbi:oxaloacetate decarboxylase, beta subunit [Caloramator quimbayensis]|uniref:Oxaloacetate decarboxylase, beta subunit n=1 Tax=Caloramator quimbayensis TaxID=1147123 RepID=A0A1T4WQ15_9CLOT|nr:sodium ion-translocating decarboxylase subunit beta [Caloramator quimbayensis]SKA79454.1 oxaloacetate decarboxylase, beta subunit [Caloramator quimbayensis]